MSGWCGSGVATALGGGPGVFYLDATGDLLPAAPLPSTAFSCRRIAGSKHGRQAALLESCQHETHTEAILVALTHDIPLRLLMRFPQSKRVPQERGRFQEIWSTAQGILTALCTGSQEEVSPR